MRNLKKLVQLLVVAALLAMPVAAVSAQSGTASNGYGWDGASDWPGVTSIVAPEALPQTGKDRAGLTEFEWQLMLNRMVAGGVGTSSGHLAALSETEPGDIYWASAQPAPSALPEAGSGAQSTSCAESWVMTDPDGFYAHECGSEAALPGAAEPSALPETGYDEASALREAYAQLRHDGSVAPAALPETGLGLGVMAGWQRQVVVDQMAARGANLGSTLGVAPAQASVSLDGITGRDRQTIIDHLAASGVRVASAQPADLPETGNAGAAPSAPSDPPLMGDWSPIGAMAAQQETTGMPSDPPLLDVAGAR